MRRSRWGNLAVVLSMAAWLAPGASGAMTKSFVLS
jgi:hypothetical protein